ncbi:MAG: hypothetical protein K6G88_03780 [Lachnospiraceae bacterium]|nr:hypothetical protein [Lachnospiraceae bacterium]
MSEKSRVIRECERFNKARKVCYGKITYSVFLQNVKGNLLISGFDASNEEFITDLACNYFQRDNIPTILLSSHINVLRSIQERQNAGLINQIMISCPTSCNYHPFYGMSKQQILKITQLTMTDMGFGSQTDNVLVYASALMDIVSTKYPLSLPAITQLLQNDDDHIVEFAIQSGFSNIIADNIRGNHEAGIVFRRVCEELEEVFEGVYQPGSDTKYNFQSGVLGNVSMAFNPVTCNQKIMNTYLKEELYSVLKRVPKIRLIMDEIGFTDENDELLKAIFDYKRQGKIELIFLSVNAQEALYNIELDFANIIMFKHSMQITTEEVSGKMFGTYQYHYPAPTVGRPPALVVTFKKDIHWHIATEERLRVRDADLYSNPTLFGKESNYLAIKIANNSEVYLVDEREFFMEQKDKLLPGVF